MALDPLRNPIKAVIYKKTLADNQVVYVPYLPRTNAEWVALSDIITIHGTNYSANTDLDEIIRALNASIGAADASVKSSDVSASLQAQINYISEELISKSGAFVYKGSTVAQLTAETPETLCHRFLHTSTPAIGWVFNISNNFKLTNDGKVYASTDGDAYKGGTNIVIIDSGTSAFPFKFDALGGDMGNHALTSEAIGSATLSGNTITFKHVDNSSAGTITFNTIGTTAVSTLNIVSTIPSTGADSSIPNVAAVRAFAGSADNVIVTTTSASSDYYITFVESTGSTGQPLYVNTGMTYNPATNVLDVTASTANQVANGLKISSPQATFVTYTGAESVELNISSGLGLTNPTNGIYAIYVKPKNNGGIAVDTTNGVSVNLASPGGLEVANGLKVKLLSNVVQDVTKNVSGLSLLDGGLKVNTKAGGAIEISSDGNVDLEEVHTTGADAVYSAVQVDKYGRATAGAQSIIFAKGINDPDLGDLVVGGLAFIGTSTDAATTYTKHVAASNGTIGVMDDAE